MFSLLGTKKVSSEEQKPTEYSHLPKNSSREKRKRDWEVFENSATKIDI